MLFEPVVLFNFNFNVSDTFGKAGDSSNESLGNGHCKLYSFNGSRNIALILVV